MTHARTGSPRYMRPLKRRVLSLGAVASGVQPARLLANVPSNEPTGRGSETISRDTPALGQSSLTLDP